MKLELELRYNEDDTPDEVVCEDAYVHLEQMSPTYWWMVVTDDKTGASVHVHLTSKSKIRASFMPQGKQPVIKKYEP